MSQNEVSKAIFNILEKELKNINTVSYTHLTLPTKA